jgi:hypothetical protein
MAPPLKAGRRWVDAPDPERASGFPLDEHSPRLFKGMRAVESVKLRGA